MMNLKRFGNLFIGTTLFAVFSVIPLLAHPLDYHIWDSDRLTSLTRTSDDSSRTDLLSLSINDQLRFRELNVEVLDIYNDSFGEGSSVSLFAEGREAISTYELGENSVVYLREPNGDFWRINVYSIQPGRRQVNMRAFYRHEPAPPAPTPEPLRPLRRQQQQQRIAAQQTRGQGWTLSHNMGRGSDLRYGGVHVRLIRVDENSIQDKYDDTVTLIVNTNTASQELRLGELRSGWVENYRITVERISPRGGPGDGRAVIQVSYDPPY